MKLTRDRLKQIIKEELEEVYGGGYGFGGGRRRSFGGGDKYNSQTYSGDSQILNREPPQATNVKLTSPSKEEQKSAYLEFKSILGDSAESFKTNFLKAYDQLGGKIRDLINKDPNLTNFNVEVRKAAPGYAEMEKLSKKRQNLSHLNSINSEKLQKILDTFNNEKNITSPVQERKIK